MNTTSLLKGISSSDLITSIEETANFPYSGVIKIDNELISYTDNFNGTLYNCVRGYQGTTPSAHILYATVYFSAYYSASTGMYVVTNTIVPVPLDTTAVWKNYLTITLSAGDWDVTGIIEAYKDASDAISMDGSISLYSGNITTDLVYGLNGMEINLIAANLVTPIVIPNYRIVVFQDTPVYLKGTSTWDYDFPPSMYNGSLHARRFR